MVTLEVEAASPTSTSFVGYSVDAAGVEFDRNYLSDVTNTISFNNLVYETVTYDYEETGFLVSTEEPMIIVLTHGYGASASHWSNVYEYLSGICSTFRIKEIEIQC